MKLNKGMAVILAAILTKTVSGQTNLNFNQINVSGEGAIRLSWNSNSNEVYEIDEADALNTNADGTTAWQFLYGGYPSQGTNTFWLDTGNYNVVPAIPHPKYKPSRFYRIVNLGTNNGDEPSVSVTAPANGAILSDQVTVSVIASSDMPFVSTSLFVDGQEMDPSDDGTNYLINTCEWLNGPHVLFATAKALSSLGGPSGYLPISTGQAVSSYVNVTFSNLISGVSFSQAFFEPSLGQTQQVNASFSANVNWTLTIQDVNTNVVNTITESGAALSYNWDGKGSNGVAIPDGVYNFTISAQTNGVALVEMGGGSGGGSSPSGFGSYAARQSSTATEIVIPYPPLPPGLSYPLDAQGNEITNIVVTRPAILPQNAVSSGFSTASFGASPDGAGGGTSAQSTTAPTRPPTAPVKGSVGTYGIGFYTFDNPFTVAAPMNGLPYPYGSKIHMDGDGTGNITFSELGVSQEMAVDMIQAMKKGAWKLAFENYDSELTASSVRRADQGGGRCSLRPTLEYF